MINGNPPSIYYFISPLFADDLQEIRKRMRSDPYHSNPGAERERVEEDMPASFPKSSYDPSPNHLPQYRDRNEEKVYQKLEELNQQLYNGEEQPERQPSHKKLHNTAPSLSNSDLDRLEGLMKTMDANNGSDPELEKLTTMMDKILDIQHPERVKERIGKKPITKKENIYSVEKREDGFTVSHLGNERGKGEVVNNSNGFFSLEEEKSREEAMQNTIAAVIHQAGVVENSSVVKLRLQQDISIQDQLISTGSFLYGRAAFSGERLLITITSIRKSNNIFPVKLEVYDLDGIKGIYVPGVLSEEVVKASSGNALSSLDITSLDPSLKAQATSAGISAVKSLLKGKVKKLKVNLSAGYQVLLKEG